jgi:class 3 adenylate cyclase
VNLASRMESSGLPGRIQVTESVAMRLRDRYDFEERGSIEVKGKATQRTYFLLRRIAVA